MVYIAYDIFSTQIRKSGASTAASTAANPAAAHSEPHITPHGGRLPFPFGTTSEPPAAPPAGPSERLPVRPGHTRSGMHSIYVRRPELRFALRSPCICCAVLVALRCCPRPLPSAKIDSVVCCSAASGLQGYLSVCLVLLVVFLLVVLLYCSSVPAL